MQYVIAIAITTTSAVVFVVLCDNLAGKHVADWYGYDKDSQGSSQHVSTYIFVTIQYTYTCYVCILVFRHC